MPLWFWLLSVFCAVIPDADVIGFSFGIRSRDLFGHRGLSHSLLFALGLGLFVGLVFFKDTQRLTRDWWALVSYFTLVTASHGVLDALTDGGPGVAFFAPFDNTRYFFPWRPIEVSPLRVEAFLGARGRAVLVSEIKWLWLPCGVLFVAILLWRSPAIRRHSEKKDS